MGLSEASPFQNCVLIAYGLLGTTRGMRTLGRGRDVPWRDDLCFPQRERSGLRLLSPFQSL